MSAEHSPLDVLKREPHRFTFDAAFRLLRFGANPHDDDRVRITGATSLAQPTAEVTAATPVTDDAPAQLNTTVIGLLGASGVMPRWYTELVIHAVRARARAIADFFDIISQRLVTAFARAGTKYRLHLSAEDAHHSGADDAIGASLLALTGFGTAHLADRLLAGPDVLQHYAGYFSARPRAAERLRALISDYLGRPADIIEFAGAWLTVPPDQQTRMPRGRIPGAFNQLGVDAAIGTRAWDQQARFIVRVGPLTRREFENLLPDQQKLPALVSLIRAYVGWEADFAVNLVLLTTEIPPLRLATHATTAPRLSWTTWLPDTTTHLRGTTTATATFGATLVEGLRGGGVAGK
jgi:type VI secretion system protein ImpH